MKTGARFWSVRPTTASFRHPGYVKGDILRLVVIKASNAMPATG